MAKIRSLNNLKFWVMKNFYFWLLISLAFLSSCVENDISLENRDIKIVINVSSPSDSSALKTSINGLSVSWNAGDKIGLYTNSNSNKVFSAKNSGTKSAFEGTISSFSSSSFIYFAYPQVVSKVLDRSNYYNFALPVRVNQLSNTSFSHLDTLLKMVGRTTSKLTSADLSSNAPDENSGGVVFHYLIAKIDFTVTNNSGSDLTVNDLTMVAADNVPVFSTSAKIKMAADAVSLTGYPDNAGDFVVSAATDPSISVRNVTPTIIANGATVTLSTMILPVTVANGRKFYVDIITSNGTYRETKTIGGTSPFTFYRGKRYLISANLNATTQTAGSNIYPGTTYLPVVLNLGASVGDKTFAPVNAGYIAITRPYGLLFQWHRKYGQDKTGVTLVTGGSIALATGNLYDNHGIFYTTAGNFKDWCSVNQSSWSTSVEYNPCPPGWKVPSDVEMQALLALGYTSVQSGIDGAKGIWIGGDHSNTHVGSLFLPENDCRKSDGTMTTTATGSGLYWTSTVGQTGTAQGLDITSRQILSRNKSLGNEVRCVKGQ